MTINLSPPGCVIDKIMNLEQHSIFEVEFGSFKNLFWNLQ